MIDLHCHLDLYRDPTLVRDECVRRGLYILSVTTTPSAWQGTSALAGDASRIRTALGLHPQLAHERQSELPLFDRFLPDTRYVGEIGLDGRPECRPFWDMQIAALDHVLSQCQLHGGRIMSLHTRRSASAVLDLLQKYPGAGTPVLHWFSGSFSDLKRAVDMGCWFSVGPAMLSGERGRALAARMPRERVLTESDGPFAQIDGAALMPWDAERAVEALAQAWSLPLAEAQDTLISNLRSLLADAADPDGV